MSSKDDFANIVTHYVCPALGCIMASMMFAAPIQDLRRSLFNGRLGTLNPFPWTIMTGNCLGWVAYGYYRHDPFVLAANLPGLILSLWLNTGAAKLQYLELSSTGQLLHNRQPQLLNGNITENSNSNEDDDDIGDNDNIPGGNSNEDVVLVSQERNLLIVLLTWSVALVYIGWFYNDNEMNNYNRGDLVGYIVNINLIFFYGAPLQSIQTVILTKKCDTIHLPTMCMNWINTSFWIIYAIAIHDMVILAPNAIGLALGLMQGLLCLYYPRSSSSSSISNQQQNPMVVSSALQGAMESDQA